jgi:protein TonB
VIINAVDGTSTPAAVPQQQTSAVPNNNTSASIIPVSNPVGNKPAASGPNPGLPVVEKPKPSETAVASNAAPPVTEPVKKPEQKVEPTRESQPDRSQIIAGSQQQPTEDANKVKATVSSKPTGPIPVGSLLPYAEKQTAPVYPAAARSMRASGVVRVEVTVDEDGNVAEVKNTSGPALLQASAKDAIRKWKFRPILVEGQAVQATGFVNFNFSL